MTSRPPRIRTTVFGYTGYQNTGDELLLMAVVRVIREAALPLDVSVLTRDPASTRRTHGVSTADHYPFGGDVRPSLSTRWARTRDIMRLRLLILGPGGFFQDYDRHGERNMFGTYRAVLAARLAGVRVIALGMGAGPLIRPWGRRFTHWIAQACDLLCMRDAESLDLLSDLGVPRSKMRQTADLAFTLTAPQVVKPAGPPVFGVSIFDFHNYIQSDESGAINLRQTLAAVLDRIVEQGVAIRFVSMQGAFGGRDEDESRHVHALMKRPESAEVLPYLDDPEETWVRIAECAWFIGMRFHSLVMALLAGVPCAAISYHPKVDTLMRKLNMENLMVPLEGLNPEDLTALTSKLLGMKTTPPQAIAPLNSLIHDARLNMTHLTAYCEARFALSASARGKS